MGISVDEYLALRRKRKKDEGTVTKSSVDEYLAARKERLNRKAVSLKAEYDSLIDNYPDTIETGFGTEAYETEKKNYAAAVDAISKLRHKYESYSGSLGTDYSNSIISNLDKLTSGYDLRLESAELRSQFKDKDEYDTAVRSAEYYNKYKDMDAEARADALERLKAESALPYTGTVGEEYGWLQSYDMDERLSGMDVAAREAEIAEMEKKTSEAKELEEQVVSLQAEYDRLKGDPNADLTVYRDKLEELRALYDTNYSDSVSSAELAEMRAEMYQAKDYQALQKYNALMENEDFATLGKYDEGVDDADYRLVNGDYVNLPTRLGGNIDKYYSSNFDQMTDDERKLYNYIYRSLGSEDAEKYLSTLQDTLSARGAGEVSAALMDKDLLKVLYAVPVGVDQFKSGLESIFDEEAARHVSATQMAGAELRESLGGVGRFAYDALQSTANMAPSILVGTGLGAVSGGLGTAASLALMGGSSGGNAYAEALRNGYSKDQAAAYGVLTGASEASLQYVLGGIGKLGGKLFTGKSAEAMVAGIKNANLRIAAKFGLSALGEATEEGLQEVLTPLFENIALGADNTWSDVDWSNAAYSALLGAVTGGLIEGATSVIPGEIARQNAIGQQIIDEGTVDPLMELARQTVDLQEAKNAGRVEKLMGKVQKETNARNVGRLSSALDKARVEQNEAEITKSLTRKGMSARQASRTARQLNSALEGDMFTDRQAEMFDTDSSRYDQRIIDTVADVVYNVKSTVNQRNRAYSEALAPRTQTESAQENAQRGVVYGEDINEGVAERPAQKLTEGDMLSVTVTSTGEVASIERFDTAEDGSTVVRLDNGETVGMDEITYNDSEIAPVYEAVAEMGVTAAEANAIVDAYDGEIEAIDYASGIKEAYEYGRMGKPMSQLADTAFASYLTDRQAQTAYEFGRIAGDAEARAKDTANKNAPKRSERKKGKVYFEGDKADLSRIQRTSVYALEKVAENLGVDIYLFESEINEKGQRIGDNGWYDPSGGSIHIDIYAGNNGKGTMLFTAAHELTHFIKEWSPEKYRVFSDFLMDQYGKKGVTVDELIQDQIDKALRNGREITSKQAFDEVVADSCETMLTDSNAAEKIALLRETDETLWGKIKDFFRNLLARIKSAYDGLEPDSAEARYVREMTEEVQRLYDLWTEALADAGEVYSEARGDTKSGYSAAQKDNENTGIQYSGRNPREVTENDVRDILDNIDSYYDRTYFPVRINTPQVLIDAAKKRGDVIENLPVVMQVNKARQAMAGDETWSGIERAHGLTTDDMIAILRAMDNPTYIVYQENGRYAEIVRFETKSKQRAIAILEIGENKNAIHMNGYEGGIYQVLVTAFVPDNYQYIKDILGNKKNKVLPIEKKNGDPQRSSGSQVPSLLNESPFFNDIIAQEGDSVKNLLSARDPESLTPRRILSDALLETVTTDAERETLAKYQAELAETEKLEKKLQEQRAEIKKMSSAKGPRDQAYKEKLYNLRLEAQKNQNRINNYDKKLLRLEAAEPLNNLLARERAKAKRQTEERYRKKLKERREEARIRKIKNDIKRRADRLASLSLHPTDGRYSPAYLIKAVAEIAKGVSYGMDAPDVHEKGKYKGQPNKALAQRIKTKAALDNLIKQYSDMEGTEDPVYNGEYDETVKKQLEIFRDTFGNEALLDELTIDQLKTLDEILRTISRTLVDARKLINSNEKADIYEVGYSIVSEMNEISKRKDKSLLLTKAKAKTLSAMRLVHAVAAYSDNSMLYSLFRDLEIGTRIQKKFEMDSYAHFETLTTGKYERTFYEATHDYARPKKGAKPFTWTDSRGKVFSVTKMQMMQAILTMKREKANNHIHIKIGGLEFASLKKMNAGDMKAAVSADNSHRVLGEQAVKMIEEFENILRDDQWAQDYMNAAHEFFNVTAKNAINDVTLKTKHRKIALEDNYIPYEVSDGFRKQEIDSTKLVQKTIEGLGMLQEVNPSSANPLVMTGLGNVLDHHIGEVATVYGLAIPVRNINKVWNVYSKESETTVKNEVQATWGKDISGYVENIVRDVQSPRVKERSKIYEWVKRNVINFTFILNLSVMLKQLGSLGYARSKLSYKNGNTVSGIKNFIYAIFAGKKILNESKKYTATLWERRQGLSDTELATLRHAAPGIFSRGLKALGYKVSDIASKVSGKDVTLRPLITPDKFIQWVDFTTAAALWPAVKSEVRSKNPALKGDALLEATAKYYDDLIVNTQSMTDVLHTSELQKSSGWVRDSFMMFKTDAFQMIGDMTDAAGSFYANRTKENGLRLYRSVEGVARSLLWTSAVTVIMSMLRRKEDRYRDEETGDITMQSVMTQAGIEFLGEFIGMLFPVYGSTVFEFASGVYTGESYDIVDNMAIGAINDLASKASKIAQHIDEYDFETEEGRNKARKEIEDALLEAASLLGIPAYNVKRFYDAVQLHIEDIKDGGAFLSSGVDRTKAQNLNRIIKAETAGDSGEAHDIFDEVIEQYAADKLETLTENNDKKPEYAKKSDEELEAEARTAALSDVKSDIGDIYKDGGMEQSEAEMYLREYFGMGDGDIYWTMDKWNYHRQYGTSEGYSKYGVFLNAVTTGVGLKQEIKRHLDHMVPKEGETEAETEKRTREALASQITDHFKPIYIAAQRSERGGLKGYLMNAYVALGYKRSDSGDRIDKWLEDAK